MKSYKQINALKRTSMPTLMDVKYRSKVLKETEKKEKDKNKVKDKDKDTEKEPSYVSKYKTETLLNKINEQEKTIKSMKDEKNKLLKEITSLQEENEKYKKQLEDKIKEYDELKSSKDSQIKQLQKENSQLKLKNETPIPPTDTPGEVEKLKSEAIKLNIS